MNEIDLRPEHRTILADLAALKDLYLTLVLKLQELTDTVKPNLEALYAVKIGQKELGLLEKQAEVAGLKYKMELMIACVNRQQKIDLGEIDETVQDMLEEYFERIYAEAKRIDQAEDRLVHLMNPADSLAMKKLYYEAAKLLHPDINPNLSPEQKQLWNVISEAYKNGDIQTVRNVRKAIEGMHDEPGISYHYDALKAEIELFKERNNALLRQISEIEAEFPFTFREKLHDDAWLKSEYQEFERKMQALDETAKKYLDYIDLMMGN
ncbi:MAG: J domain-containing protein [Bacteroidota bacterium]